MNLLRQSAWRLALVLSAVAMIIGGPMHPDSDAADDLRTELATMTASDSWVPGHTLVFLSALLLTLGLWTAYRRDVWPAVRRPLLIAAIAFSLYTVETIVHLLAVIDSDALANGESAPIAMTHVGLGALLYPVSGWALVFLAYSMGRAGGWRRVHAGLGILAGLLHALSVPLVLLFPDLEVTPIFAAAGMLIALWTLVLGIAGAPRARVARDQRRTPVTV